MSKLKTMREQAGLSQSQLAAVSGVKLRMIQQYEIGARDVDGAKIGSLAKLALTLECSISDILEGDELIETLKKVEL